MTERADTLVRPSKSPNAGGAPAAVGRNGVPVFVLPKGRGANGYRSYEVHQRMRVAQSTEKLDPARLVSADFARDPYPTYAILRENYPCYRDWIGNAFWISRYDDVTSVFVDDANYETRSKLWWMDAEGFGRDLRDRLPVQACWTRRTDEAAEPVAQALIDGFASNGEADLALDFAALYPLKILAHVLDLPAADFDLFAERYWRMQRGWGWRPADEDDGKAAMRELATYFAPLLEARRANPGEDLLSVIAALDTDDGPTTPRDVVVTLLEADHETLHGGLANLLLRLLTHPEQLERVKEERRLVKMAWLETLRHSPPVLNAYRFARHEVERFGLLLPEGALVVCLAGAANHDPRVFSDPDRFHVERKDLCPREPRGQYRADGLPSGIAFGLGPPSRHPAAPQDRPRSLFALTRDTAVTAVNLLLDRLPGLRLQPDAEPVQRSLQLGEMHACWGLPVAFDS